MIKRSESVTLADIRAARRRIASGMVVTPCPESIPLSEITGARIFCILDNQQRTGSFKERGARNALLRLSPAQKKRGVIAASAGNHAPGRACHGKLLGIPGSVVMPDYAPLIKVSTSRRSGVHVIICGRDFTEARAHADTLIAVEGLIYSFKNVEHDRAFSGPDIFAVNAVCTGKTRDQAHISALHRALRKNGFPLVVSK